MKLPKNALAAALMVAASSSGAQILHYDTPAKHFEEALPIGNGKLGAMVYGRPGLEKISLNDITLWTGEPEKNVPSEGAAGKIAAVREALAQGDYAKADSLQCFLQGHYSQNYQPLGTLTIRYDGMPAPAEDYTRNLNLENAIATTVNGSRVQEVFASSPDSVIVISLDDPRGLDFSLKLSSRLPVEISAAGNEIDMQGYCAYHSLPSYAGGIDDFKYDPGRGIHFRTLLKVVAPGASVTASGDSLTVKGSMAATILIANETSFNGFDKDPVAEGRDYIAASRRVIDRASAKGLKGLQESATDDYRRLYSRVNLDLGTTDRVLAKLPTDQQLKLYTDSLTPNPDLEELYYQYGRYLLIASSRTPGVPANLQGLWNESLTPPWSSNYTTNINLEENYWGATSGNLTELHAPLLDFIDNLSVSGKTTAHNHWAVDSGWCLGHNTDIWAMTNPVGLGNDRPQWANWNMGGAWLATHIWEQYLFTRDRKELEKHYPALRGAADYALAWLDDVDGVLTTWPSTSPENEFLLPAGKSADTSISTTADMALIRECLLDTRGAAATLGIDHELIVRIDSVLPRLRPYEIKPDGSLNEWSHQLPDRDPQHRHQSHLIGLYPGHHISPAATPGLAGAAARTLEIKGTETTGWSAGWRVNLLARLNDADGAYGMLRRLLRYVSPDNYRGPDRRTGGGTYPNMLDAHSPFQIDGNFGGSAGIAEMIVQSTPDTITLLPALPSQWADGSISGILTRTGIEVALDWKDRLPVSATFSSPTAAEATVVTPAGNYRVALNPGQTKTLNFPSGSK